MQRRQFIQRLGGAAAATLALPTQAQAERNRIVLGQSAALSGPAAELGLQFQRGAKLYFERLNARGGINGRVIELRSLDDGYEPERCKANTERLIREEVFALFGYIGTPTSLAALPLATAAKVPFVAPFTGAQALRDPFNRYAFHVRASYFDETARIVNQLASLGTKKIAVFHQNDSYGQAGLDGVTRAMKTLGLTPVATATVERNSVEVADAVKAITGAGPEAVVQISAYKSCAAFIRAARKAGYGGGFYNVSFVGTAALSRELGADARGVVVSQVMPYPFAPVSPLAGEYLAAGQGAADFEVNYSSMEGYVAAKVLAEALRRTTGASREDLVGGLENLREHDLGGFFVDFNARKHTGSTFAEMTILTQDGRVRR
ncbi:ABC transporter substrate-binding protein [uncultured Methylibium sp.]|uniref:ABC transporter substrate-binding protein n=1 Tax=uncultured Methylibium sp. TaxID=381093 RepID=UPI0025F6A99C|nr:ABC transporter substrate-binding protein [uncultured Methylibium sp.]